MTFAGSVGQLVENPILRGDANVLRRTILLVACVSTMVVVVPTLDAQEWARKMFAESNHDFGVVARGAKAEYRFAFQNLYKEDVHVAGVRSSCGCTFPEVETRTLKSWEKGEIIAKFNTRSFLGSRSATITVAIDKPYYAEVQLQVNGYIRSDVVFEPGAVNFGEVEQGSGAETRIQVNYAGRSDWEITDVRSANAQFEVELGDPQRRGNGVAYEMIVRLKPEAPAGYINDQLSLVTNDGQRASIPLAVEGRVRSALSVSPSPLILGVVAPGEQATKKLLVRAKTPFRVLAVTCDGEDLQFAFDKEEAKATHFIPVTLAANAPGNIERKIRIETDLGAGVAVEVVASAEVKAAQVAE